MGKRRIDVSGSKVTANVLATVTGAAAASRFGVAGTLTGTVLMSVASSAGTTVYQYYLNRGGEKVRAIHPAVVPRTRVAHGGPGTAWETADSGAGHGGADSATASRGGSSSDTVPVAVGSRADGPADEGAVNGHAGTPSPTLVHFPSVSGGFPSVSGGLPAESGGFDAPPGGNGSAASTQAHRTFPWRETDWKRVAVVAAVTLVLAIAVISVIELAAGRPLGAIVGGQHASGTSIGNVLGRHPSTGVSPSPSGPGTSVPVQTPAQRAHNSGPTPAGSFSSAPTPGPTAPASVPASGISGNTGNGGSPAPTP